MKVLFVGRSQDASRELTASMRKAHIACDFVIDGIAGFEFLRTGNYDLALVAVDLPDMTGLQWVRRLRAEGERTPVIMLSGSSAPHIKVNAFNAGVDDFLARPIHPDELLARTRAAIRRSRSHGPSVLSAGSLALDLEARRATVAGTPVPLSRKEYDVLELLMLREGQLLTKEALLTLLYGGMDEPQIKIIDVFICKLRKKLAVVGADHLISTVWGRGYVLLAPAADAEKDVQIGRRVAAR